MDEKRFDALTRALAAAANRRTLFQGAALALAGLAPFARTRLASANATCGIACAGDADCANSQDNCLACCGGVCVSALDDVNNCNGCGIVCPGGANASCSRGNCQLNCPDGLTPCGDNSFCADLTNDINNCQSCGNACGAPSDACCPAGCVWLEQDDLSCGSCGHACGAGLNCCGGQCVDLSSDPGSCGACGNACAADQVCRGFACAARCPAGQLFCDPNCVNAQSDPANCGACGNACAAGQTCQGGACVSRCPDGQLFCDPNCVDAQNDVANCGGCGVACDGVQRCQGGACVSTCAAGTTDCGAVCVDLTSDRTNCGACGTACSRDTDCVNGACVRPQCPKGQTPCQDGCVDTKTDAAHCGGCHNACVGGTTCCGGACVDLTTDPKHCGRCDFACPPGFTCDGKGCVQQSSGTGPAGGSWTASPDLCVTKTRTAAELSALLSPVAASSPAPIGTPSPGPSWKQITKGAKIKAKAASSALTQTITDAVVQVSACGSANDPARQTALMTDALAARWLAERGVTPDQLATISQTTPAPLPPQSWTTITAIDGVVELGKDVVNALVTYAPLSSAMPPRQEIHVFKKDKNGWLLDAIQRVDQFTAKTGSLALRLFDCPAGVTPYDPGAACSPTPELQFGYELASADGKVRKSLADAAFLDEGLLLWNDLPPGPYDVIVSVPSGSGVTTVITGDRATINRPVFSVLAGRDAIIVDVYHEHTAISDIILHLQLDAHCGPCSRQDSVRAICVPTCPPCSVCGSVARADGKSVSFCRSVCASDQVCQFDDRFPTDAKCCVPNGGTCTTSAHCCAGACQKGVCACAPSGADCAPGGCCAGTICSSRETCDFCKPLGLACAASAECCSGSCFDGVCRCCAGVENNDYTKTHLCCAFPYALMEINDGPLGPGFKRCCAIGVDCIGDPFGPPLSSDNFGFTWAPVDCGPAAAPGQVCANNEPKCPLPGGPACCDPDPYWGNAICVNLGAQLKEGFACAQASLCPAGSAIDPTTRRCVCPDGRDACPTRNLGNRAGQPPFSTECCAAGTACLPVQNNADLGPADSYSSVCCPAGTLAFWEPGPISPYQRCLAPSDPRVCGTHLCDAGKICVNGSCA